MVRRNFGYIEGIQLRRNFDGSKNDFPCCSCARAWENCVPCSEIKVFPDSRQTGRSTKKETLFLLMEIRAMFMKEVFLHANQNFPGSLEN